MILDWIIYVTLISLLVAASALIAESIASMRRSARRYVWLLAMTSSLLLPLMMATVAVELPASDAAENRVVALREVTSVRVSSATWLHQSNHAAVDVQKILGIGWGVASCGLLIFLALHVVGFQRQKRAWRKQFIGKHAHYVTPGTGPAVFGFLRPEIVLPAWLGNLSATQRTMIFAHERSHIDARDPQLLLAAYLMVAVLPWNIPLWWQFQRLRRAIEMDCDRRILRAGVNPRDYGEALIAVAQRRSAMPMVGLSMSHSPSFMGPSLLERRIAIMSQHRRKASGALIVALSVASVGFVTAAAQISPPRDLTSNQFVSVDPSLLDRYVGAYRYSESTVMHVRRQEDHLQVLFTGQGIADDVYSQDKVTFFYTKPGVDAQLQFVVHEDQPVAAILRQNGAETRMPRLDAASSAAIEDQVSQRVAAKTPSPNSEAALRELIANIMRGRIDAERLSPQLVGALRKDLPKLQVRLAQLGAPTGYKLATISPRGADEYEVTHEHGSSRWGVVVTQDGVITGASVPL